MRVARYAVCAALLVMYCGVGAAKSDVEVPYGRSTAGDGAATYGDARLLSAVPFPDEAPCGPRTILVVHADSGDRYAFCADGDGLGVLEVLADGDESRSLMGHFRSATDLLAKIVPEKSYLPDDVLVAVGAADKQEPRNMRVIPFVIGRPRPMPIASAASKSACAAPPRPFDPGDAFFHDDTLCGIVHTQTNTSNNSGSLQVTASLQQDDGGNEGSHQHAGPHEYFGGGVLHYYADEDEDGGARYGYSRVRSCDGSVRLRSWKRPSPGTDSWEPIIDASVHEGATAGYYMWGNPSHSLWMGYDSDDMRFRVDVQGTASFGALVYYAKYAWGTDCDLEY